MKLTFKYLALMAVPLVVACSGHPAAGKWQLVDSSSYQYTRLVVNFDGKAEFYKANADKAWLHCFWTARAVDMISLECASADEDAENEIFDFKVSENEPGQLLIGNQVVAKFNNQDLITK